MAYWLLSNSSQQIRAAVTLKYPLWTANRPLFITASCTPEYYKEYLSSLSSKVQGPMINLLPKFALADEGSLNQILNTCPSEITYCFLSDYEIFFIGGSRVLQKKPANFFASSIHIANQTVDVNAGHRNEICHANRDTLGMNKKAFDFNRHHHLVPLRNDILSTR